MANKHPNGFGFLIENPPNRPTVAPGINLAQVIRQERTELLWHFKRLYRLYEKK